VGGCTRRTDALIRVGELMLPARWLSGTKGSIEGLCTGRVLKAQGVCRFVTICQQQRCPEP
jgi:hypothetical protein